MQRRSFLKWVVGVSATLIMPIKAFAQAWNKPAFDAVGLHDALAVLKMDSLAESSAIKLVAPDKAENGAIVQVEVHSQIPNSETIYLIVEHNPTALLGQYDFKNGAQSVLVTRIKMAETSNVKAIIKAGGRYYTAEKKVEVLENGCGGGGSANEKFEPSMKLRARLAGSTTEVKAIIVHPMHTGRGKADNGELIPAHFIQTAVVLLNEKPVLEMQYGTGIAKNPYLTFYLEGAQLGDTVQLSWQDNQGYSGKGSIQVTA